MKFLSKTILLLAISIILSLAMGEFLVRQFVVVRNVGPSFTEYDEVYGKKHKKGFSCERITPEYTMQLSTNSLGFRGPEPLRFPERGILIFGDSFTEGYGVSDDEVYPELVRRIFASRYGEGEIPVVNTAMGDLGNGFSLKFLNREGSRFHPRLVVLQITNNDFTDNPHENFFSIEPNGLLLEHPPSPAGSSRLVQKAIEAIPGVAYSRLIGLVKQAMWASTRAPRLDIEDTPTEADLLTYRIIDSTLTLCEQNQWPVIILSVRLEQSRFTKMQALADRHQVPFIRTPEVEEHPELFYPYDGHWKAEGHQVIARQLLNAIDGTGLFEHQNQLTRNPL